MTRIYEALEQFDLEHSGGAERPITLPQVIKRDIAITPELTETLIGLYRTLFNALPGSGGRIIQFVESGKGFFLWRVAVDDAGKVSDLALDEEE